MTCDNLHSVGGGGVISVDLSVVLTPKTLLWHKEKIRLSQLSCHLLKGRKKGKEKEH